MMRRLWVFLPLLLLLGCSGIGMDDAKSLVDTYYSESKAGNYEEVTRLFSKQYFYVGITIVQWKDLLGLYNNAAGDLLEYKLVAESQNPFSDKYGKGTEYKLVYEVKYSVYPSTEYFTILHRKGEKEMSIKAFNIKSDAFKLK